MGGVARGCFANAAIAVETTLAPQALLEWCKTVEGRVGRRPSVRWADRVVDLDILMYGEQAIQQAGLEIPHPGLLVRDFALRPAQEVAPELVHPGTGRRLGATTVARRGMWAVGVLGLARGR